MFLNVKDIIDFPKKNFKIMFKVCVTYPENIKIVFCYIGVKNFWSLKLSTRHIEPLTLAVGRTQNTIKKCWKWYPETLTHILNMCLALLIIISWHFIFFHNIPRILIKKEEGRRLPSKPLPSFPSFFFMSFLHEIENCNFIH